MGWFTSHLYLSVALGIALVVSGALIIKSQSTPPQEPRALTWGGIGGYLSDPIANVQSTQDNERQGIYSAVQGGPPFYYDPPTTISALEETGGNFDFDAFLAMLSRPSGNTSQGEQGDASQSAYSFIPSGLVSTSVSQGTQTPTQQALRAYGNNAGSIIQAFEPMLRTSPQILKDQFEDRGDSQKNTALVDLAQSLANVGHEMEALENVPAEIASAHLSVAKSYQEMGEKLANIANQSGEQAAVDAILTYNASVETYIKNYASLATLFSVYGVAFTSSEAGNVFTFTNVNL